MTSFRQIEANRRNARKSTGPNTEQGKQRSRCNAVRHGLTAETVIGALEDAEDYKAFEAAIIADYNAQSAVERELVLRLASLLWRLRRATAMETGLFDIQAEQLLEVRQSHRLNPDSHQILYALFGQTEALSLEGVSVSPRRGIPEPTGRPGLVSDSDQHVAVSATVPTADLARRFLQLANLPNFILDRLSRYEVALWRQVGQTLLALDALDRRKPQERRPRSSQVF
jgi:hypothetical protein